jgi:hypothetical protein
MQNGNILTGHPEIFKYINGLSFKVLVVVAIQIVAF